jgi:NACalpha-BTF3-like transcription factor
MNPSLILAYSLAHDHNMDIHIHNRNVCMKFYKYYEEQAKQEQIKLEQEHQENCVNLLSQLLHSLFDQCTENGCFDSLQHVCCSDRCINAHSASTLGESRAVLPSNDNPIPVVEQNGLDNSDINTVMIQTSVSRDQAIHALNLHGSVVDAILSLCEDTMPDLC